jgi:hypothetical protein
LSVKRHKNIPCFTIDEARGVLEDMHYANIA